MDASGASLQMVVGGYTIAFAMLLITGARLGDQYGHHRMFLLGAAVFTAASLACGLAPNTATLVIFRVVQGAAAGVMVPQIMSVIQTRYTGPALGKAMSAYGMMLSVGAVAGLVLGGVIANANLFDQTWRPNFLINVPIGAALIAALLKLKPADEPRATRRLDLLGLAIAVSAVFLLILPLVLGRELDWPAWTFVCMAVGLVLGGVFVAVERRITAAGGDPLLNMDVLRSRGFRSGMTTLAFMQVTYGGFLFAFTLHEQVGLGGSALRTGLMYIPMSVTFGFVGFAWRKLPEHMLPALAPVGLAFCAVAFLGFAAATQDAHKGGPLMWLSLVVWGLGMGLSVAPLLTQSLVNVPWQRAADASGVLTTVVQFGQALGIAVAGTLFFALREGSSESLPLASSSAIGGTGVWLAVLSIAGVASGIALSRTVLRTQRTAQAG
jgi:MFS family permease